MIKGGHLLTLKWHKPNRWEPLIYSEYEHLCYFDFMQPEDGASPVGEALSSDTVLKENSMETDLSLLK